MAARGPGGMSGIRSGSFDDPCAQPARPPVVAAQQ